MSTTYGRAYDHVQAWVNSLPQPSALPAQPVSQQQQLLHLVQPQQWPDLLPVTAAAAPSSTSRLPAAAAAGAAVEWTTQSSARQLPSGLDYAPAGPLSGERSQTNRACLPDNNKDRPEKHDGSQALQFMKANHCSFSSDASVPSSVEDILNERKGNPEELLRCLGFGSHKSSMAVRLPARFLTNPSHAKGIEAAAIIARHPELLTLKEPLTDALSVELLHKLPSYYQRELVTSGDDAETFSSLHRRFSERLSTAAAGEAAVQQQQQQQRRRESLSLQRSAVCGRPGRHGPSANATAGDRSNTGGIRDFSGDGVVRQDFTQPSEHVEEGPYRPTVAAVHLSGLTRAATSAANRQDRMTASLSSLSDSVFMSNSDGAEIDGRYFDDDDDMEGTFDPSRWMDPDSLDGLGNASAGRGAAGQHRLGSVSDDRHAVADLGSSRNGARRGFVPGRHTAAAALQKHRSLDLQELTAAAVAALPASAVPAARAAAGGGGTAVASAQCKFATPVTVLVTSHDGGSTADAANGSGGDGTQPASGLLLRVKSEGRSPTGSGSRTPVSSNSPMFLTVGVDSFESCESDTQTITGDMADELGGSVAGGGGISRCASSVDDDVAAAAAAVISAPPAATGERGTASGNRLLLAVAPAMESFEMEEVQSIGDTTRRGTSTMNRSHSAQSDSSGFADTEDERQQQSPPSASANEAGDHDGSGGAEQCTTVKTPRACKMVDVVDAMLNLSAQKNRLLSLAAHSVAPAVESQFADAPVSGDPLPTSTGQHRDLSSAAYVAMTASMPPPSLDSLSESAPTEDEYSSALDALERRSSLGLQSECSDELPSFERMPTRVISAERQIVLLPRSQMEPQPLSAAMPWDCQDGIPLVGHGSNGSDDGELSATVHGRQPAPAVAAAVRRAPSAFSSTKEDSLSLTGTATQQQRTVATPALAAFATSRRLTLHGAPLMRQSAIDLNVVQQLPSPCVLRQSRVIGSLVQVGEAAVVEEECSPSLEPAALPNWYGISAVAEEEEEETIAVSSAPTTACGVAASPATAAYLLEPVAVPVATVDCCRCPPEPQHLAAVCPRVALSSPPGSELSGRLQSAAAAASDASSAVLMALLKPASPVTAHTAPDPDVRLVQRAVQRYRATAYETDALLDALAQSLPDDVRRELAEELESLDDVRQSVAHEAVLLEASILERLSASRAASAQPPRSASQTGSPPPSLNLLSSPLTLPVLQQHHLRRQSAAGSVCSSKASQSSGGVVEQCTKLLKEQIYQQKLLESRGGSAAVAGSSAYTGVTRRPDAANLQQQVTLLETKQKYEQRIAELEVTTLKLMLQAKEEEIKRLKLLTDID